MFVVIVFCLGPPAGAAVILDDTFNETTQVNTSQTSASVDTVTGWVQLPGTAKPNLLAVKPTGNAYAMATQNGIKVFEYDGLGMLENTLMAIPGETSAVAVAFNPDQTGIWVLTQTALKRYDFNGTGMTYDSTFSLTGLSNVLSLSAQPTEDALVLLSQSGTGTGVITSYLKNEFDVLQQSLVLSFDTGITSPVAVSVVPGSLDLVFATTNAIYYYVFNADFGSYVLNPFLGKSGLSGVLSVSTGNSNSYAVLKTSSVDFFRYDPISGMAVSATYSTGLTTSGLSLSVRPQTFEYAVLDSSGSILYYVQNAGTGTMTTIPALGKSGLSVSIGNFSASAVYQSIQKTQAQGVDTIKLTVYETNDLNTSIAYQYSINAGASWVNITSGSWISISSSTSFILKAALATTNTANTPRLTRIVLEGTKLTLGDLKITEIAMPPPGQPVPASLFPAVIRAGAEFAFEIETDGYASQVSVTFSGGSIKDLLPVNAVPAESNRWQGTFVVPRHAPSGYVYQLDITAISGISGETKSNTVNSFVMVNGTVMQNLKVRLLCTARDRTRALAYPVFRAG